MKKLLIVVCLTSFLLSFAHAVSEKTLLLASSTHKVWYNHGQTPPESNPSYSTISKDNTFIFYADGTFKFDHGTITEDPGCVNECSSDLVNLTGTWKLTNNQKRLKVTTAFETGNPQSKMEMVLIDATITQLTEDRLVFSQKDEETGAMISFEFRTK